MLTQAQKEEYARRLIKGEDPFVAAFDMFPDQGTALQVGHGLPKDLEFQNLIKQLTSETAKLKELPDKADLAKSIWDRMTKTYDASDFAKLGKLYAEVRGYIEKPEDAKAINVVNQVMVVPVNKSDSDWANGLREQQKVLSGETIDNG